jgi:hypothetical protein
MMNLLVELKVGHCASRIVAERKADHPTAQANSGPEIRVAALPVAAVVFG